MIIKDIKASMWSFEDAKVEHEMRESNEEAHCLAKAALSLELGRHLWLINPPDLRCIPTNIYEF